jgi:hypothetical protein
MSVMCQERKEYQIKMKKYHMQQWLQIQHAPLAKAVYTYGIPEPIVQCRGQALCQHISHLIPSREILQLHHVVIDDLPQEVVTNVDMFGAVVELRVLSDHNGRLVVDEEGSGMKSALSKLE